MVIIVVCLYRAAVCGCMSKAVKGAITDKCLQDALLLTWEVTKWIMDMLLLGAYAEIYDYVAYAWGDCLKILFGDRVCKHLTLWIIWSSMEGRLHDE